MQLIVIPNRRILAREESAAASPLHCHQFAPFVSGGEGSAMGERVFLTSGILI
jgi:hypothetical protein